MRCGVTFEAVDRAVPREVGELVGKTGRSADVPALWAERDDGLAQRPLFGAPDGCRFGRNRASSRPPL
jgi:hypothetical protein